MGWKKSKAEKAHDYLNTLDGRRAYEKAMFTSDEALKEYFGGAEITRQGPECTKCKQSWDLGTVTFTVAFDDGSTLTGLTVSPG